MIVLMLKYKHTNCNSKIFPPQRKMENQMAKNKKRKGLGAILKEEMRSNKRVFILWLILRLFVIAALVLSAIRGYYDNVFVCVLVLFLFLVPAFIER